ncbi:MAG: RHS repeat protein, partial [Williamsia herbipolensis]|nr:RHS repeat protein [Williamsia herbipolensis]
MATVPHLTFAVNPTTKLVTSATDELGRSRSATYTPQADVASSTEGSGATAGTTTNEWGANGGYSETKSTSPGGASSSATYGNTAAATKYLASGGSDDAGNASTYTYNGTGNQLTSSNALAAMATLTYNSDGTVATALAPGNGSNVTKYGYNANHQLSALTPVTGSSLGARAYTYDDLGRTKTATDGRGITTTYGYDLQDRLLTTSFSDGTPTVVNAYTDGGQVQTRQDANGTSSYGYDQLGRLTSRQNSFGGGSIAYGYDKASNLVSTTDSRGTTTNSFDASGIPTKMTYNHGSGTQVLGFTTDDRGRRTDTYLQTNSSNTIWQAHTHQDYDTSGRVSRVLAESRAGTAAAQPVMDVTYCYNTGSPAPTCATGTAGDRSKLQWQRDNLTGQVTTYSYDGAGRLTQAAQSGGTGANTYAYTYDARGNRLTATVTGATPSSQTFTANAANQISSTGYTFDGAGNLTADPSGTYAYTGAEQMKT